MDTCCFTTCPAYNHNARLRVNHNNSGYYRSSTCIYKLPKGSVDRCITFLKSIITSPQINNRGRWVIGDFNMNIELRNTPEVLAINGFLKDNSLRQLITAHSRLTSTGISCID